MDTILLCTNHLPTFTSIHNAFIEHFMLGANGSYVKVYLYLAKCIQGGEENLSISYLADKMENTEKDVIRALNYWEKQHLLKITRDEQKTILGIDVLNPEEAFASSSIVDSTQKFGQNSHAAAKQSNPIPADSSSDLPADLHGQFSDVILPKTDLKQASVNMSDLKDKNPYLSMASEQSSPAGNAKALSKQHSFRVSAEQSKRLAADADFGWICQVVESYLEHPLKPGEIQLISYLYDNLHFSSDLILHLYEYCISLGKTNTSYIQTVAISWDENAVKTPDDAARASTGYNASYNAISKAFALGRGLAAIEKKYVDRWKNEWKIDLSVILEACNRTMLKIQKADFKYAEGILDNWHKSNIHTLQDVEKADKAYAQKRAARQQNKTSGTHPQSAPPKAKNTYSTYVQHGLSRDDADLLEKQLLNMK